jgi:hypothetical protein
MTEPLPADPMAPVLIRELRDLLTGEDIAQGANLLITQRDDWVQVHIMAISTGRLGALLATLSDPAELNDPDSLSCRITPGDDHSRPGQWQYELIAGRYPSGGSIVFSAKVRLPISDLPEVVSRVRRRH